MSGINQVEIRCQHCRNWFPSSVVIGDDESFDTATLNEEVVICPLCGKPTGTDPANVRVPGEDAAAAS